MKLLTKHTRGFAASILLICLCFLNGSRLNAQVVTIGTHGAPLSGALLEIKSEGNDKGMTLPRVYLEDVNKATITKLDDITSVGFTSAAHTALTVYNMKTDVAKGLCPGPYTWNGSKWIRLWEPCDAANKSYICLECGTLPAITLEKAKNYTKADNIKKTISVAGIDMGSLSNIPMGDGDELGKLNGVKVLVDGAQTIGAGTTKIDVRLEGEMPSTVANPFMIPVKIPGINNCAICPIIITFKAADTSISGSANCTGWQSTLDTQSGPRAIVAGTAFERTLQFELTSLDKELPALAQGTVLGSNGGVVVIVKNPTNKIPAFSSGSVKIDVILSGYVASPVNNLLIPVQIPGTDIICGGTIDVITKPAHITIVCDENKIASINTLVCDPISGVGSILIEITGDITMNLFKDDIIGELIVPKKDGPPIVPEKKFQIIVEKSDGLPYVITKDKSAYVNVKVVGPASTSVNDAYSIPINFANLPADRITGADVANYTLEGCPYSRLKFVDKVILTTPKGIYFTSGLDGLSWGLQDAMLTNVSPPFQDIIVLNSPIMNSGYYVRPWGTGGIPLKALSTRGETFVDDNYKFRIIWGPKGSTVTMSHDLPLNPNRPAIDFVNYKKSFTNEGSGTCFDSYELENKQDTKPVVEVGGTVDVNDLVWKNFLMLKSINEAPRFTGGGGTEQFIYEQPYTLSQDFTLTSAGVPNAKITVYQIHYGLRLYNENDQEITFTYGKPIDVFGYNGGDFIFKIRSNAKWKIVTVSQRQIAEENGIPTPGGLPLYQIPSLPIIGPEEEPFGGIREETIVFKAFPDAMDRFVSGGAPHCRVDVRITSPKIRGFNTCGQQLLQFRFFKKK